MGEKQEDGLAFKKKRFDARKEITKVLLEHLADPELGNTPPWAAEWDRRVKGIPLSCNSKGVPYKGVNRYTLSAGLKKRNSIDPRWMTFKQASEKGFKIRKGAKSVQVLFFAPLDFKDKHDQSPENGLSGRDDYQEDDTRSTRWIHRVYNVFNGKDIEGISDFVPPLKPDHLLPQGASTEKRVEVLERFIQEIGVKVNHDASVRNPVYRFGFKFASNSDLENQKNHDDGSVVSMTLSNGESAQIKIVTDLIEIPPASCFINSDIYYQVILHEIAHWTGGPNRLGRIRSIIGEAVGDAYNKEELVAEIAAANLFGLFKIPRQNADGHISSFHPDKRHALYLKDYLGAFESEKSATDALYAAIRDADKAIEYLAKNSPTLELLIEQSNEICKELAINSSEISEAEVNAVKSEEECLEQTTPATPIPESLPDQEKENSSEKVSVVGHSAIAATSQEIESRPKIDLVLCKGSNPEDRNLDVILNKSSVLAVQSALDSHATGLKIQGQVIATNFFSCSGLNAQEKKSLVMFLGLHFNVNVIREEKEKFLMSTVATPSMVTRSGPSF